MKTREPTPRSEIDESKYCASFCEKHGWFASGLKGKSEGFNSGRYFAAGCPQCAAEKRAKKNFEQSQIPLKFSEKNFENYVVSNPGQEKVLAACKNFAASVDENVRAGKGLLLIGTPGTGKTHLGCSILSEAIREGKTALFTTVSKMLSKIKSTWVTGSTQSQAQVIRSLTGVDILVLDEIGTYRTITQKEKDLLFEIINERYEQMRSTIFISNLNISGPESIEEYLEERIMDRLCEQSKILIFNWKSYRRQEEKRRNSEGKLDD